MPDPGKSVRRPLPSSTGADGIQPFGTAPDGVLDLEDLLLLLGQGLCELLDVLVLSLLNLFGPVVVLIFGDFVVVFHFLQHLHAVAAHVAHRHARLLGIVAGDLGEFDAALFRQGRDRHAHELAVAGRVEAEAGIADRLLDGTHHAAVPYLHGDHAPRGHGDRGDLVQRHAGPVGVALDRLAQGGGGAAPPQDAAALLQRFYGAGPGALPIPYNRAFTGP